MGVSHIQTSKPNQTERTPNKRTFQTTQSAHRRVRTWEPGPSMDHQFCRPAGKGAMTSFVDPRFQIGSLSEEAIYGSSDDTLLGNCVS